MEITARMEENNVQIIRNFPFPGTAFCSKKNIEDSLDYTPRDGDIVITSFPKTGTTWLQYVVLQILTKSKSFPSFDEMESMIPFLEMTGTEPVEILKPPRLYKHHIPYNMLKKNDKAKYLYVYRHPEDTIASYYHFLQDRRNCTFDFDPFFEKFIKGELAYGCYFEHVLSYFEGAQDQNLLLISYEKLHKDRRNGILRIAKFLGEEYFNTLMSNSAILDKILEQTSFDYMKRNLRVLRPVAGSETGAAKKVVEKKEINFFRKGKIGDGSSLLSSEQQKRLRKVMLLKVKRTDLLEEWTSN